MKLVKCDVCGNVYELIGGPGACVGTCCGKDMRVVEAGVEDAAQEKHVPAVVQDGQVLHVVVGEVEHPMLEKHYITNIWAEFEDGTVERSTLIPGTALKADFDIKGRTGKVTVYEYCNLHGLWKTTLDIQ